MTDKKVNKNTVSETAEAISEDDFSTNDSDSTDESYSKDTLATKTSNIQNASAQNKSLVDCGESGKLDNQCLQGTLSKNDLTGSESKATERDRIQRKRITKQIHKFYKSPVCREFANGICSYGNNCKFYHPLGFYNMNELGNSPKKEMEEVVVCRHFVRGTCHRGDYCPFYHSPREVIKKIPVVCRYFAHGMCKNGNYCEFYHPPREKYEKLTWFKLCNFQSGSCPGEDCRDFHISHNDEKYFRDTGEIAPYIFNQAIQKSLMLDVAGSESIPTCKDYLKNICYISKCPLRHVSRHEYEDEIYKGLQENLKEIFGFHSGMYSPPMFNYDGPQSRENTSQRDYIFLHKNYIQLEKDFKNFRREKEGEISSLKIDLKNLQDCVNSSGFDKISIENYGNLDEGLMKQNTQMHEYIEKLQNENKTLRGDLKAQRQWKELNAVTQMKLESLQLEYKKFQEELSSYELPKENQRNHKRSIGRLKIEQPSWIDRGRRDKLEEEGEENTHNELSAESVLYYRRSPVSVPFNGSTRSVPNSNEGSTGSVPNTYGSSSFEAKSKFLAQNSGNETYFLSEDFCGEGSSSVSPYSQSSQNLTKDYQLQDDVS